MLCVILSSLARCGLARHRKLLVLIIVWAPLGMGLVPFLLGCQCHLLSVLVGCLLVRSLPRNEKQSVEFSHLITVSQKGHLNAYSFFATKASLVSRGGRILMNLFAFQPSLSPAPLPEVRWLPLVPPQTVLILWLSSTVRFTHGVRSHNRFKTNQMYDDDFGTDDNIDRYTLNNDGNFGVSGDNC